MRINAKFTNQMRAVPDASPKPSQGHDPKTGHDLAVLTITERWMQARNIPRCSPIGAARDKDPNSVASAALDHPAGWRQLLGGGGLDRAQNSV